MKQLFHAYIPENPVLVIRLMLNYAFSSRSLVHALPVFD
jgi:hypothetical protein